MTKLDTEAIAMFRVAPEPVPQHASLHMSFLLLCQVGEIPLAGAYAVAWSPAGAYLQTFERPSRELGNAHKNLKVPGRDQLCI